MVKLSTYINKRALWLKSQFVETKIRVFISGPTFSRENPMVTVLQELVQCCSDRNESIPILKEILSTLTTSKQRYLIDVEDRTNRSALFHAIETKKSIEFIKEILDFNAKITSRILLSAIRHGNLSILHLLKYYGADFRPGTDGVSLLHECVLLHKNHFIEFLITEGNVSWKICVLSEIRHLFLFSLV